jgi:hypothetical protein
MLKFPPLFSMCKVRRGSTKHIFFLLLHRRNCHPSTTFISLLHLYIYVLSVELQTSCICCCSCLVPFNVSFLQIQHIQQLLLNYFYVNQHYTCTHHPSIQATSTQEYPDCIHSHVNILLIKIIL